MSHEFERQIGTDPNNKDTDGDKLFDGDEVNYFNTNPLKEDTDGDGLNDFQEISLHSSDPRSTDTDGDDLGDYDEVHTYKSNPNLKDTDGDGLSDGYEVNIYETNPALSDTDGDILEDNDELKKYKTDPLNPDTDGDGILDGEEINKYKTNPLVKDAQEKIKTTKKNIPYISTKQAVVLEGISFETNKAEIKSESEKVLNKTFLALQNDPTLNIEIRGFTDNVGDASYNKKLSQDRADAVRIWLVQKGIDALRIKASGYGEDNPIADNSTPDGRNKNRRIEIIRIK